MVQDNCKLYLTQGYKANRLQKKMWALKIWLDSIWLLHRHVDAFVVRLFVPRTITITVTSS